MVVCSGVRVVLVAEPSDCTSSYAAVHAALVSAGGAGSRDCEPDVGTKGCTEPQVVNTGGGNAGGVSWESPGFAPGTNGGGVTVEPSPARTSSSTWPTL